MNNRRLLLALIVMCMHHVSRPEELAQQPFSFESLIPKPTQESAPKVYIRAVKNFAPSTPVTVTLLQGNKQVSAKFKKSTDELLPEKWLHFNPLSDDDLTISASIGEKSWFASHKPSELLNQEMHVVKMNQDPGFQVLLKPQKVVLPKKQKVRAMADKKAGTKYTVEITDAEGNKISNSKFEKNTDGLGTNSLYIQLNKVPELNPSLTRYNFNVVKISEHEGPSVRKPKQFTIYPGDIPVGRTIYFKDTDADIINKNTVLVSKTFPYEY